jgi:antirestriction protein ArdC
MRNNNETIQQLVASAVDRLVEALEAGQSDALRAFLSAAARFHRYSFGNVLLIASQRPEATRVAGFNTWRTLNRFVKKGEKGIAIMAPLVRRARNEEHEQPQTTDAKSEAIRTVVGYRVVYVFDVAQTDGEPLPDLARAAGDPGEQLERLKTVVSSFGIALEFAEDLAGADGLSKKGTIVLRDDLASAEEFSVLVHELAHELLHQGERRAATTKGQRELEAEAVACIVSESLGLQAVDASSDYIQLYRGDREALEASLADIQKTAARILEALG